MKPARDQHALQKALKPLWDTNAFEFVTLFGSLARGSKSPGADLDLAVFPKNGMDEVQISAEIVRLTHNNNVDLVNLKRADPVLAMQVATTGVVLFEDRPSRYTEFRSLAFRRFIDTEKLRRAARRALDRFEGRS